MSKIVRTEFAHSVRGVEGRMFNCVAWDGQHDLQTFANQQWGASREIALKGYKRGRIAVTLRFDDNCRNGHNDFSMTCNIEGWNGRTWQDVGGGADHESIVRYFPELASLAKWHLTGADGPMHYLANALYLAGDRDYNGKRVGEVTTTETRIRFGNSPISQKVSDKLVAFIKARSGTGDFQVVAIAYSGASDYKFGPNYTLLGFGEKWHDCPFKDEQSAREFCDALNTVPHEFIVTPTAYSEGKARELDSARRVAVWPDATDEQLSAPREELKAALEARLPALLSAFRADMDSIGFIWSV